MKTMKAVRFNDSADAPALVADDVPLPSVGQGQLLVRVRAAAATAVNRRNHSRAPLLLMGGSEDHLVPAVLNRSNHQKYADSDATTSYREFAGRSHGLIVQEGWQEVAEFAMAWAQAKATKAASAWVPRPFRSNNSCQAMLGA